MQQALSTKIAAAFNSDKEKRREKVFIESVSVTCVSSWSGRSFRPPNLVGQLGAMQKDKHSCSNAENKKNK